jgi:3-hydroxyacyl-[acyl-carrier-protein] dehydratase
MDNLRSAIRSSASGPVRETEPGTFIRSYCFAPDFIGFSGHFPGYPILPAFIQVLMVVSMAEEVKGHSLRFSSLEKAKFQNKIFPDQEIEVRFRERLIKGKPTLEATLAVVDGQAASFQLIFDDK